MPVTRAKGAKGKADALFSRLIRSRGRCEYCGEARPDLLQTAHIVSRRYSNTRTDERNAFCLCAGCHFHFTHWPLEFHDFVVSRIGHHVYADLRARALATHKVDWDAEVHRLKGLLDE